MFSCPAVDVFDRLATRETSQMYHPNQGWTDYWPGRLSGPILIIFQKYLLSWFFFFFVRLQIKVEDAASDAASSL